MATELLLAAAVLVPLAAGLAGGFYGLVVGLGLRNPRAVLALLAGVTP